MLAGPRSGAATANEAGAPFPCAQLLRRTMRNRSAQPTIQATANDRENGLNRPAGVYNPVFYSALGTIMEAEQLNIIANRLADLAQRTAELRRYL